MNKDIVKWWLMFCFCLLWWADVVLTYGFVTKHGLEAEANPLMRYVIGHWGWAAFIAIKLAVGVVWAMMYKHVSVVLHVVFVALAAYVVWLGILMNGVPVQ